jgi:hypothetical protein
LKQEKLPLFNAVSWLIPTQWEEARVESPANDPLSKRALLPCFICLSPKFDAFATEGSIEYLVSHLQSYENQL